MKNKKLSTILYIYTAIISFVFYIIFFKASLSTLPYSDEIHAYFQPGLDFFNKGLYNFFNMDAFSYSFGHPPIFHIIVWFSTLVNPKSIESIRTIIFVFNCIPLFMLTNIIFNRSQNIFITMLVPLFYFSTTEVFYYMHQLIPEIVSVVFFLGIWTSLISKNKKALILSSFLFMLTREYSIVLIPIIIGFSIYQYYLSFEKRINIDIKTRLIAISILPLWFLVHKFNTNAFIEVFATSKDNFMFNFEYWFETISSHIHEELILTHYIYFLPLILFTIIKNKSSEIFLLFLTSIFFFTSLSFYNVSIARYLTIGLVSYFSAFLISIALLKNNVFKCILGIVSLVIISININSNKGIIENRYDGAFRVKEDYNILKESILTTIDTNQEIYTDQLYKNMCLMLNHFESKSYKCQRISPLPTWDKDFIFEKSAIFLYRDSIINKDQSIKDYFINWSWFRKSKMISSKSYKYFFINTYLFKVE